jgi:hypothetical protein
MSSMPLRIDGGLVKEARRSGEIFHRSIPQQVEHWATLGQRLEAVVSIPSIARIKGLSRANVDQAMAQATGAGGRKRMLAFLNKKQGTSYGVKPGKPNVLIEYRKAPKPVQGRRVEAKFVGDKRPKVTAKG